MLLGTWKTETDNTYFIPNITVIFEILICIHIYVACVCVCMCMFICVNVDTCRRRRKPQCLPSSSTVFEMASLWFLHCIQQAPWPRSPEESRSLPPSYCRSTGLTDIHYCVWLSLGSQDPNWGLHAGIEVFYLLSHLSSPKLLFITSIWNSGY